PVLSAMDTLALSGCLGGALILSPLSADGHPWPVRALAQAGLTAQPLDPMPCESLFAAERQLIRDALVSAGLAAMMEWFPPLAVVHVTVDEDAAVSDGDIEADSSDPWAGARAWWYPLKH